MSEQLPSPHWILLLAAVPLVALLRRASHGAAMLIARYQTWKTARIAADVGVHITDLLGTTRHDDALRLIRMKISDEVYLRAMRILRLAEHAARDGVPGAEIAAESIRGQLDRSSVYLTDVFRGFTVPTDSPLARRYPSELSSFNDRMRRLLSHWRWTDEWLYLARQCATPRP